MAFVIQIPALLMTIQDLGRFGWEQYGVPPSGPMDWFALCAANRLVGNTADAAGIEFAGSGPVLQVSQDCLIAVTGQGYRLFIQGRNVGLWMAAWVRRGETIQIVEQDSPGWGYISVAGGIQTPLVMGSRSTYIRGRFGGWNGRKLEAGDDLPARQPVAGDYRRAGRRLEARFRPDYNKTSSIPVIPGPQADWFLDEGLQSFWNGNYSVRVDSDRMGYRLEGPEIERNNRSELPSEGMPHGSIQVPLDGQPIVMMSDRPVTGGYPKVGVVARAGLPVLAQAMPGSGLVKFQEVSVPWAQEAYRAMVAGIEEGVEEG